MIRPAVPSDLPHLLAMGERFIGETNYRATLSVNPGALERTAVWLMSGADRALWVCEQAGTLVGMLGVAVFDHPLSGARTAGELFWWMEPEHRGGGIKLLKMAERWAKAVGATRMQMVAPTDQVARVYERVGYALLERNYEREL